MNKGKLKEFAIWGRKELIEKIKERLALLGITKDNIEQGKVSGNEIQLKNIGFVNKKSYYEIIRKYEELGYDELVEESAYTWFNRLVAFAYMEGNEYYEEKMVMSTTSKETPDIIDTFIDVDFFQKLQDEEKEIIFKLQDEHKIEELYARLVDYKDKELSTIMPFMFKKDLDYLMLLFPKNILMKGGFISRLSKEINDTKDEENKIIPVEIIGWLYQYYNSDIRETVYNGSMKKEKIKTDKVPAATQLFTPDWIVKYMVENSLGKLAIESLGVKKEIINNWKYFIDSKDEIIEEIKNIEDIKIIDPAMGSGHMLTYAIDVLFQIYEELGWSKKEAALSILKNNVYGLEIDKRAGQLASFAVIMKLREHYRRIFKELEKDYSLNTLAIEESNYIGEGTKEIIRNNNLNSLLEMVEEFEDAKEYGSILKLKKIDVEKLEKELKELDELLKNENQTSLFNENKFLKENVDKNSLTIEVKAIEKDMDKLKDLIKQYMIMSSSYDVVVTNPPYMGSSRMNAKLKKYVDKNYKDVKSDLFAVFIEKCFEISKKDGYLSFMSPFVWMFIKSYEKFREEIISNKNLIGLIQLEYSAFEDATVPICTFVLRNSFLNKKGVYIKLSDFKGSKNQPIKTLEAIKNPECGWRYQVNQKDFEKIPGSPIAYWVSDRIKEIFEKSKKLGDVSYPKKGMDTSNNDIFLRQWFEIERSRFKDNLKPKEKIENKKIKWFPYNKGGEFRKWYGNNDYFINWKNSGESLKKLNSSNIRNEKFYFHPGITWTDLSSGKFCGRYFGNGFIFDTAGPCIFERNENIIEYLLGFLNTKISQKYLDLFNSTMHYLISNISNLPLIFGKEKELKLRVNNMVIININIAKEEWDSRETSWDFESLGMLNGSSLEEGINNYCSDWKEKFYQMHKNEEELNRIFIGIYELQDEMDEFVDINDITLLKNELLKEDRKLVLDENNEIVFNKEELIKQFLSYAVGCIMGRYSLNKKGLIIANSDDNLVIGENFFEVKDNEGEIRHKIENPKLIPDEFGIIPVTNTKIFENDIVDMVIKFVKASFGEENLEENLKFIGNILNKNGNSPRETIRNYFIKDFYADHLKRYKKRPIYWMLSSGKTNSFQSLVYMHRYEQDTVGRIRTDYLNRYQEAIEMQKKYFENQSENEELSPKERKSAEQKIKKLGSEEKELKDYATEIKHIAEKRINIDLDDGVKVNYEKFKKILKKI